MNSSQARDSLRLARAEGVGPVAFRRLLLRFGDAAAALDALPGLARAGGRAGTPAIPTPDTVEREIAAVEKMGGCFVVVGGEKYPARLAELYDAPPVLAVLGDPALLGGRTVALVGSRNASVNGQRMAETLADELAKAGFLVVSGMARGVDAAAHRGALRVGKTIAAVAGGLDIPYPAEHADLQREIAASGAVVAEAPLGTAPLARHFPRRNRVIAGLSEGVVVIEAALRSGSLITARLAGEAGREVFAVPGSPLDPRCRGSNDLLRQGAHLTETLSDVLEGLIDPASARGKLRAQRPLPAFHEPEAAWPEPETRPAEQKKVRAAVAGLLGPTPTAVDDLLRRCQFSAPAVMAALLELELAGRAETLPGNRVALIPGNRVD
jgi:DNA processing protein